jgi:signal transduction histidine kinase
MTASEAIRDHDELMAQRVWAGIGIIIGAVTLFIIADLRSPPPAAGPLLAIQGIELGMALVAAILARRGLTRSQLIAVALVGCSTLCLTSAAAGILRGTTSTTPLLLMIITMGTATLLPWGVRPQIVLQIVAAVAFGWSVNAESGALVAFRYLLVAVAVGYIAALYAAHTLEQHRLAQARAEAVLEETRARQHRAELAHAARLSTLGEMAAGLAHELNQPLSAIVSYATGCQVRIESGTADVQSMAAIVGEISTEALRAAEVLRRIHDFARNGELRLERVDPNDLVRSAVELANGGARRRGIAMRLELGPDPLTVEVDRVQIEQVILNLLRNAFDAMEGTALGERRVRIRTTPATSTVDVTIDDSGAGLPSTLVDRVFDPFFTTKPAGLGLGLAISRRIIEAHGGRLWGTPNDDRGSTFGFTLPIVASDAA